MKRFIDQIYGASSLSILPQVQGHRSFPTRRLNNADPFVLLDHVGPDRPGGNYFFDGTGHDHPHRGFETITLMLEGEMEHRDSLGNSVVLQSGDVQLMNAGSGIIHGGNMKADALTGVFHEVQLWVNVPAQFKMSSPFVQTVSASQIPVYSQGAVGLQVLNGRLNGLEGPIHTRASTQMGIITAQSSGKLIIRGIEKGHPAFLYSLDGDMRVGDTEIGPFQMAELGGDATDIEIAFERKAKALFLSGKPINEPVVMGGPFVMNTQQEIDKAYEDYRNGHFGVVKNEG